MDTITLSEAKASLGRLVDKSLKTGRPVIGRRGAKFFQIAPYEPPEPVNYPPAGSLPVTALEKRLEKLAGPDLTPSDL